MRVCVHNNEFIGYSSYKLGKIRELHSYVIFFISYKLSIIKGFD